MAVVTSPITRTAEHSMEFSDAVEEPGIFPTGDVDLRCLFRLLFSLGLSVLLCRGSKTVYVSVVVVLRGGPSVRPSALQRSRISLQTRVRVCACEQSLLSDSWRGVLRSNKFSGTRNNLAARRVGRGYVLHDLLGWSSSGIKHQGIVIFGDHACAAADCDKVQSSAAASVAPVASATP